MESLEDEVVDYECIRRDSANLVESLEDEVVDYECIR